MPSLKTAMSRAQATVTEIHRDRLFVACVLLSVLLHALALVAYRGQTSIGLRVFEPVGILIYVTPQAFSVPLVFMRFAYFVTALLLLAEIYRRRAGTQA